jgi:hypothetical protein
MLFTGENKVTPYARVSDIQKAAEQKVAKATAEETARRAKLPLAELQKLVSEEIGKPLGEGLKPNLVPGSNPKRGETETVRALHETSEEEKAARKMSTEELRAIEVARQREARKTTKRYGDTFSEPKPSGRY